MVLGFPVLGAMGYSKEVTMCTVIAAIYHIIGLLLLYIFHFLTIERVAMLRSSTEFLLLGTRIYFCLKHKSLIQEKN